LDAVWVSPLIKPEAFSFAPFYFGVGDLWAMIVDFDINLFLGQNYIPIYRPHARRLISKQPRVVKAYILKVEKLFLEHHIPDRLNELTSKGHLLTTEEHSRRLNIIDT